ncbi:MAG: transporter permease [Frankiales bacterium]|nr:transporter permease [Frankiales bacterium]
MNTYLKYEIIRLFRNRQNFIFSLIFPFVLYLFVAGQNRHEHIGSLTFPTYYMAGMIAFGTVGAVMSGGARIAIERQVGWVRQLRISPLSPRSYFRTKLVSSYLMACITIALLYGAGSLMGVRMNAGHWLEMTGLILVGLIPFAALGIMLGHLIKGDSMGPVMGGGMSFLSILGGAFFPLGGDHSVIVAITKFVPSYWIVQAGHTAVGGAAWGLEGWLIVAGWSLLLTYGAVWAYRRDTGRV